jgi:predicted HTH domain antitoxin
MKWRLRYGTSVTIEVSDDDLGSVKLTSSEAKLDFAIGLYTGRHLSMGRAAKVAGISYSDFLHELGRRGICINYSSEDLAHDLKIMDAADRK